MSTITLSTSTPASGAIVAPGSSAVGVEVDDLVVTVGRTRLLDGLSLRVAPGEVFAVAGVSGAGKSTLLEAIAGVRAVAQGTVRLVSGSPQRTAPASIGFVPQDDIVHRDLPLRTSLRYAARLRLPGGSGAAEVDAAVDRVLCELDLTGCATVRVGDLSGGQRKRASIAMELLTHPDVLLLDEPTSGLDPAGAAEVVEILRSLAAAGTTVILTTHHVDELERADRFAFLGRGGQIVFVGSPAEAGLLLDGGDLRDLYRSDAPRLGGESSTGVAPVATAVATGFPLPVARRAGERPDGQHRPLADGVRRWWVLTRRNVALLGANRLTLAILFGSPAMVIAMMTILFPAVAGGDLTAGTSPTALQLPFWTSFAAFFFGLTAGLLQIVPEAAIAARERRAGVGAAEYVLSKVASLTPALIGVSVGMLVALHAFDRLPTAPGWSAAALVTTVLLAAASALALGLLASAAVRDPAQATLALPMLCFPQVLFAGAVVAVDDMAPVGRVVSHGMSTRWGFEGITDSLGLGTTTAPTATWIILATVTVALLAATTAVLRRR